MKKKPTPDLTNYHKARNERMVRKVSGQPLLSPDEFTEHTLHLARQSSREAVESGLSSTRSFT